MSKARKWAVVDGDTGKAVYLLFTGKEARQWAAIHNADERDSSGRRHRYRAQRVATID